MAMGVSSLTFGGRAKYRGNIVIALDIRFGGKVKITTVGLGFASESVFKVLFKI